MIQMTRLVHHMLIKCRCDLVRMFVGDPGNARVPSFDAREHRETIDALTNVGQFGTDGGEFTRADNVRLTDGDEVLPFTCRIR